MQEDDSRKQRLYEQLGAPTLIYRNRETYTPQDEDPRWLNAVNTASAFYENQSTLHRSTARWYYPIDCHLRRARHPLGDIWKRKLTVKRRATDEEEEEDLVHDLEDTDKEEEEQSVTGQNIGRSAQVEVALQDGANFEQQTLPLQLEARANMLVQGLDLGKRKVKQHAKQKLRAYTQFDANYVVSAMTEKGVPPIVCLQTRQYDRERQNRADPAYLAPFHLPSLRRVMAEDVRSRGTIRNDTAVQQETPGIARDDPRYFAPSSAGNCLCSFPCVCGVCRSSCNTKGRSETVVCLLHAVGPLLDRIRLSFLAFPRGRRTVKHEVPRRGIPEELDAGDRVRQIQQCGRDPHTFVVRTSLNISVFTVTFAKPQREEAFSNSDCWGSAELKLLHRFDHRTLWRSMPSYRPIDVSSHPNYGVGGFTGPKLAIAYESSNGDRNILHHVLVNASGPRVQKRVITNLQDISETDFSFHHPMVLWAAARSYVRPALTAGYINRKPRMGHGYSLYSIDLRSSNSEATFQWSPSAEEFVTEGLHSLSGIYTDWKQEHSVWASSISASKTWEIDARMPCRAVTSWSLPHYCDQVGSILPATGLQGAGTIFSQPYDLTHEARAGLACPMLSVGKSPGVFGLHLYQRPEHRPLFQTRSFEATAGPELAAAHGRLSVATSATFALPDVSDKIFTCGLTTIRLPIQYFAEQAAFTKLGYEADGNLQALCALSVTTKGDLYAHTLLESRSCRMLSKAFQGLPLGSSMLPAPCMVATPASSWNTLLVSLSNEFPVPSQSLSYAVKRSAIASATVDLSHFGDKRACERNDNSDMDGQEDSADIGPEEQEQIFVQTDRVPKHPVVAVRSAEGDTGASLSVPSHLVRHGDKQRIEYFDTSRKSLFEKVNAPPDAVWRSDLTPDILNWAETDDAASGDG